MNQEEVILCECIDKFLKHQNKISDRKVNEIFFDILS
jgi:hypothetical protein